MHTRTALGESASLYVKEFGFCQIWLEALNARRAFSNRADSAARNLARRVDALE
jgi:hypothetical protein